MEKLVIDSLKEHEGKWVSYAIALWRVPCADMWAASEALKNLVNARIVGKMWQNGLPLFRYIKPFPYRTEVIK